MRSVTSIWLGRRRYAPVHELQRALLAERRAGRCGDLLFFLEHEPVVTLGRGAQDGNVLASPAALREAGIDHEPTGRGGDVTLHAPGQLVCYPILDLNPDRRDVRRYVNDLTAVMQRTIAEDGIASGLAPGMVGLWVDLTAPDAWQDAAAARSLAKIGAIGVRISRWVTMHGFALNVTNDLGLYRFIVPCGISAHPVTSLAQLTGKVAPVAAIAERARQHFARVFAAEVTDLVDRSQAPLDPAMLTA